MSKVLHFALRTRLPHRPNNCVIRHITGVHCNRTVHFLCRYRSLVNDRCQLPSVFNTRCNKRFYSDDLPNHNKVLLPALSPTMESGTIVNWAKKEGDKLNEGDLLAEIETDKATMGFETPEEGYLAKILISAGSKDVPIGKLVCIIVDDEASINAFKDYKDDLPSPSKPQAPATSPPQPSPPKSAAPPPAPLPRSPASTQSSTKPSELSSSISKSKDRIFASPFAKLLASEKGLNLASIGQGSGLYGSIKAADLSKARPLSQSKTTAPSLDISGDVYEDRPVSSVRDALAKILLQSKQTVPHYYLTVELNLDEVIKLRKKFNDVLEKGGEKLTLNDFIVKATALASRKVPEANSVWMDTFIRQYNAVDVTVTVSTDQGLITPIVFDADLKGLLEINRDINRLSNKAKEGALESHEFQGGTISVSNLGAFNIKNISPIIIPPQACILGVGSVQQRLIPDQSAAPNGTKVANIVQMTLSCDHRVVDGAVGAQWLSAFRQLIEHPQNMLL